jgi:uncharacterized protein (DUF849 family)
MAVPDSARKNQGRSSQSPTTLKEPAVEAERCAAAGATIIHLHVRAEDGHHSRDPDLRRSAMRSVQTAVDDRRVVQITTESIGLSSPEAQVAVARETLAGGPIACASRTHPG